MLLGDEGLLRLIASSSVPSARPTWVLRGERSKAIRPLPNTSRYSSGCNDSVPCLTSEFDITTPACTMSPGAISYFSRGVMTLRYILVSVSRAGIGGECPVLTTPNDAYGSAD
jgi:hypothetical protein